MAAGRRGVKKTLYSLMLSDEVVREVDALAHRSGLSRSALVDRILAETVSVTTPERRIGEIFRQVEVLTAGGPELVPLVTPNARSMSLKSCLAYKYRPTVKYEVELCRSGGGTLLVSCRTRSPELQAELEEFLDRWRRLEEAHLAPLLDDGQVGGELDGGRFTRPLAALPEETDCRSVAGALTDYIRLLDRLLKGSLDGLSPEDVERAYMADLDGRAILF